MKNRIVLTNDNINTIKADSIIAITIAEGGAMGDPGAVELVDKDLKLYYSHFGEVKKDSLENIIPFLKTLKIGIGEVHGLPKDWEWLYTGYGNHLFVRQELKDGILKYIKVNYKNTKMPEIVELYSHWYEALESMIEG